MVPHRTASLLLARAVWRSATERLVDVLAPPRCAACDARLRSSATFCGACVGQVELDGARVELAIGPGDFVEARAGARFLGPVADAIRALKFRGRSDLVRPLAPLLARALDVLDRPPELLVHVPLHPRRRIERGFDQAALLARALSTGRGTAYVPAALERARPTPQQAKLGRAERAANVDGAFVVRLPRAVAGRHVCLVDDVLTTGSTAAACARVLASAGAARVSVVALARALDAGEDAPSAASREPSGLTLLAPAAWAHGRLLER